MSDQDRLAYLIDRPLKEYWYKWNVDYRIKLRVMIFELKQKIAKARGEA